MGSLPVKKNFVKLMLQLYASKTFKHVALQKPVSTYYSEVVAFQENKKSAKNLLGCFFNCKIVTGHEIIDFSKNYYSLSARTCNTLFSYCCASQWSRFDDFNKF